MLCAASPKLGCPGAALVGSLGTSECARQRPLVTGSLGQQDGGLLWGCSVVLFGQVCVSLLHSEARVQGHGMRGWG